MGIKGRGAFNNLELIKCNYNRDITQPSVRDLSGVFDAAKISPLSVVV